MSKPTGASRMINAALLVLAACGSASGPTLPELVDQLNGRGCTYSTEPTQQEASDRCKRRTLGARVAGAIGLTAHEGPRCSVWASNCIGQMGPSALPAVPLLLGRFEHGPNDFDTGDGIIPRRSSIARALAKIGDASAVQPLLAALLTPRPYDRPINGYVAAESDGARYLVAAADALGEFGPRASEVVPSMASLLENAMEDIAPKWPDSEIRRNKLELCRSIANAFGKIGDRRSVPSLIKLLEHPEAAWQASEALRKVKDPRAVQPLVTLLGNPESARHAALALLAFAPQAQDAVLPLSRIINPPVKGDLASSYSPESVRAIRDGYLLEDKNRAMQRSREEYDKKLHDLLRGNRDAALQALEKIRPPEAIRAKYPSLSPNELSEVEVEKLWGQRPDSAEILEKVARLLNREDADLREAGRLSLERYEDRTLCALASPSVVESLTKALSSSEASTAVYAAYTLGRMCAKGMPALPLLEKLGQSPDRETSRVAKQAAERIRKMSSKVRNN